MELSPDMIKRCAKRKGMTLKDLLLQAGVSRTAYYSLVRKESVLPKSIRAIARTLEVTPTQILVDTEEEARRISARNEKVHAILAVNPAVDPDNVRHTLLLLDQEPEERLRRALLRGRTFDFH